MIEVWRTSWGFQFCTIISCKRLCHGEVEITFVFQHKVNEGTQEGLGHQHDGHMPQLIWDTPQYTCLAEIIDKPFYSSESIWLGWSLMWSSCYTPDYAVCYYSDPTLVTVEGHEFQIGKALFGKESIEGERAWGDGKDNKGKERGASESTKINYIWKCHNNFLN